MPFTFNPESKLQERLGQVAVATLLGAVCFGLIGCDIPFGDEDEKESAREPAVQATAWVAPPVDIPEPIPEVELPRFDPATVTFEEAGVAFNERRYEDAVDMFAAYAERHPDNAWGHYMVGLSALKAGQLERSESAFNRALERNPNHLKSMTNLGRVLLRTDRPERALAYLDVVVDIDPVSDAGYRLRGLAFHELGRDEDAIDSFREAITVNQHDAWSMNNLGLVLIRQERFEEALLPLARATELRDDVAVFQNNLGIVLERTGYFEAAAEAYRAALAISEGHDRAAVSLARVEVLEDDALTAPLDLKAMARRFVTEMEGWYPPMAHVPLEEEPAEQLELDAAADTQIEPAGAEQTVPETADSTNGAAVEAEKQDSIAVEADSAKAKPDSSAVTKIKPIER